MSGPPDYRVTTGVTTAPHFRASAVVRLFTYQCHKLNGLTTSAPNSPVSVVSPVVSSNPQKSAVSAHLTTRLLFRLEKKNIGRSEPYKGYAREAVAGSQEVLWTNRIICRLRSSSPHSRVGAFTTSAGTTSPKTLRTSCIDLPTWLSLGTRRSTHGQDQSSPASSSLSARNTSCAILRAVSSLRVAVVTNRWPKHSGLYVQSNATRLTDCAALSGARP